MSGMEHNLPNMIGVDQSTLVDEIRQYFPDYDPLQTNGMGQIFEMGSQIESPINFLPLGSPGPFGLIDMTGMFTIMKVREGINDYRDPGWYGKL